ncbi:methyltransferase domain-containing protein [Microvirga sp. W0021]|uniref:Methyltransferase domain-containing protein n=1 Tax=Hohaiivirga grylli TaxID=3133970 RepID=A0ABV0BJP4_9HYPH
MTQNIYDDEVFFKNYADLPRSKYGHDGAPEWPVMLSLLPELQGKRVADLGCGYGWFCRYARDMGSSQILGLDVSQKMLEKAHQMGADGITYSRQDLETLLLPENSYDLVYSSLTLHYLENLQGVLKTILASLVSGGYFIFSAEHPIFTAPSSPDWTIDNSGRKSWPVNDYQLEGQRVSNWMAEGVIKQHRTLGTYIDLLVSAGFMVKRLVEWGPSAEQIATLPALDEEKERPMIFLMSCQKHDRY